MECLDEHSIGENFRSLYVPWRLCGEDY